MALEVLHQVLDFRNARWPSFLNITSASGQAYTYDAMNRLTSAAGTAIYAYDPAGRLYEEAAASTQRFLYAGDQVIAALSVGGTIVNRFVPGPSMDERITWRSSSNTRYWPIADERGSVQANLFASGAILEGKLTYDEYGVPASTNTGRFGYTGQMRLSGTGLYHYKAREYAPALGRFLQPDPIGYSGGANLYAYVGADPVNWTDPLGLSRLSVGGRPFIVCAINETPEVGTWTGGISACSVGRASTRPRGANSSGAGAIRNTGSPGGGIGSAFPGAGFSGAPIQSDPQYAPFRAAYLASSARTEIYAEPVLWVMPVGPAIKLFRGAGLISRLGARAGRTCNCFVAGTEVQTSGGLKLIEQVAVGDEVLARDELTGETVFKPVVALIAGSDREIWEVTVETSDAHGRVQREPIGTTDEHPWRTAAGAWLETKDLTPGTELVSADGDRAIVITVLKTDRIEPTYNFEVEGSMPTSLARAACGCITPFSCRRSAGRHAESFKASFGRAVIRAAACMAAGFVGS